MSKTTSLARALEEYQESEALRIAALESETGTTDIEARQQGTSATRNSGAGALSSSITVGTRAETSGTSASRSPVVQERHLLSASEPSSVNLRSTRQGQNRLRRGSFIAKDEYSIGSSFANNFDNNSGNEHESSAMLLEEIGAHNELIERFSHALQITGDDDEHAAAAASEPEAPLPRMWIRKAGPRAQQKIAQNSKGASVVRLVPVSKSGEEEDPADLGFFFTAIPKDVLLRILLCLDEDSLDLLRVCNPAWRDELLSERLWHRFCERVFVRPAFRPIQVTASPSGALVPRKFDSWDAARRLRPRVRTETGIYILKSTYVRTAGPRTLWSPEDYSAVLEMKHYRYLLFKPDGQVLYASTPFAPNKMRSKFKQRLFQDWVAEGLAREVIEEQEGEEEGGEGDLASKAMLQQSKPVERMSRRKRAELLRLQRQKLDTTKGDVIHTGLYSVSGGIASVVVNLVNYTVTFDLKLYPRDGSHDILQTVRHQSVYHKDDARVIDYELSKSMLERLWNYYSFQDPHEP